LFLRGLLGENVDYKINHPKEVELSPREGIKIEEIEELSLLDPINEKKEVSVDENTDLDEPKVENMPILAESSKEIIRSKSLEMPENSENREYTGVPIDVIARDKDFLCGHKQPEAKELLKMCKESERWSDKENETKEFRDFLSKITGWDVKLNIMTAIFALFKCHIANNIPLPEEVTEKIVKQTEFLAEWAHREKFRTDKVQASSAGGLVLHLIELIKGVVNKVQDTNKKPKIIFYCAHDGTLLSLLHALGIHNNAQFKIPDFGSCMVFELWSDPEPCKIHDSFRKRRAGRSSKFFHGYAWDEAKSRRNLLAAPESFEKSRRNLLATPEAKKLDTTDIFIEAKEKAWNTPIRRLGSAKKKDYYFVRMLYDHKKLKINQGKSKFALHHLRLFEEKILKNKSTSV